MRHALGRWVERRGWMLCLLVPLGAMVALVAFGPPAVVGSIGGLVGFLVAALILGIAE